MNQTDLATLHQAIALAQSGQREQAYWQFKKLIETNSQEVNVLLWLAFTSPDLAESAVMIDQAMKIAPNDPNVASARNWLITEKNKQLAMSSLAARQTNTIPYQKPEPAISYQQPFSGYQEHRLYGDATSKQSLQRVSLFFGLILLAALGMAWFTGSKLYAMAQIEGSIPGAKITTYKITQKLITDERRGYKGYWVSWTNDDIKMPGNHRVNLEQAQWERLKIGDPIQIVRVGDSGEPYVKGGIYTSEGNFAFDEILLVVEVGTAIVMLVFIFLSWSASRSNAPKKSKV